MGKTYSQFKAFQSKYFVFFVSCFDLFPNDTRANSCHTVCYFMKDRASLEARCSWQTTAEHRHLLTNLTHRLNKGTPAYITLVFEEDAEGSKWKSLCAQNSKHTNKMKNLRTSLLLLVAGTQSSLSCYASLDSTLIENMEYALIQHPHVNVSIVADSWNNSSDIMFSKHYGWYCTEWLIVMFYDQISQYCFGITLYITVRIRTDATLKKTLVT